MASPRVSTPPTAVREKAPASVAARDVHAGDPLLSAAARNAPEALEADVTGSSLARRAHTDAAFATRLALALRRAVACRLVATELGLEDLDVDGARATAIAEAQKLGLRAARSPASSMRCASRWRA